MRQRLLTYAFLLPIVVLAVMLLLWVKSYFPGEIFIRCFEGRLLLINASDTYAAEMEKPGATTAFIWILNPPPAPAGPPASRRFLGFQIIIDQRNAFPRLDIIAIPFYAIALVLVPLSVWSLFAYRNRKLRLLPNHCAVCGYDLRASTGRCPECGTPI